MRGTLQAFHAKLDDLRQYVGAAEHVDALVSEIDGRGLQDRQGASLDILCSELANSVASRRRLVYTAVIVGLYGSFENFAEELVMAFLHEVDMICPSFHHLPKAVQQKHVELSAHLLLNRESDKYRDRCTVDDVVWNLSQSGAGRGRRRVNYLAFTQHKSNFRAESLNDFFAAAGISGFLKRVTQTPSFRSHLVEVEGMESVERLSSEEVFRNLNDLSQRRNEVAHGHPSSILKVELMQSLVNFMQQLGTAMLSVTEDERRQYLVQHSCTALPKPIAVYRDRIACFELESASLQVGDAVATRLPTGEIRLGEVARIEADGRALTYVSAPPTVKVGVELNIPVKQNHDFFQVGPASVGASAAQIQRSCSAPREPDEC